MLFQYKHRKGIQELALVLVHRRQGLCIFWSFLHLCKRWLWQESNKTGGDQSTAVPDLQPCCSYSADKMVEIILSEMWMEEF